MSARSSSSVACSAAVRTMRPCCAGLTRSRMPRRRLRTSSGRRLEMPYVLEFGISTTKRPGSETSWVSRAPLAPIGFFVTWQTISWRARRMSSMRGAVAALLDVLGVVLDVAAVQHGVLRRGDVDERGLHAGQHVLHPADVDVAVDLADVVGRPADVVLDQVAALEHGDLGHVLADLHAHQVATDGPAVALAAAALLGEVVGAARQRPAAAPRGARGAPLALAVVAGAARRLRRRRPRAGRRCGPPAWRAGGRRRRLLGRRRRPARRRRAGVADLRLAHERPLGGLDRRTVLAQRLGQLRARRRRPSARRRPLAAPSGLRRRWPPREPRRRLRAARRRRRLAGVGGRRRRHASAGVGAGVAAALGVGAFGSGRGVRPRRISLSMVVPSHAPTRGAGTTTGSASTSRRSPSCSIH